MATATSLSAQNTQKVTILVVEDDADEQQMIHLAIHKTFGQVDLVFTHSAQESLDFLHQFTTHGHRLPQLILLDLYLPDREDGWHLLASIRAMPIPLRLLPIVVLSRSDAPEDIRTSYDRGVNSYIVKPDSLEAWTQFLLTLKSYWLETASLPVQSFF